MNTRTLATLTAFALAAPLASAAITAVAGQTTWLGSPPVGCNLGQLAGFNAFAWDEQQGIFLSAIACDMVNNPGSSTSPIPGIIAGIFNSHFIHFDGSAGASNVVGKVGFDGPIIGVIFSPVNLSASDLPAGAFGTSYPTGYPFRGLYTSAPSMCSISGNTLTFNLSAFASVGELPQIRVLTHPMPTPGSLSLLGLAGLMCGRRRR